MHITRLECFLRKIAFTLGVGVNFQIYIKGVAGRSMYLVDFNSVFNVSICNLRGVKKSIALVKPILQLNLYLLGIIMASKFFKDTLKMMKRHV